MIQRALDWLNRNAGAMVVAFGAAIGGTMLLNQGNMSGRLDIALGKLDTLQTDSATHTAGIASVGERLGRIEARLDEIAATADDRLDGIEKRFDDDATDLRKILVSTGTLDAEDVFYAAEYAGALWVFPGSGNDEVRAKLGERGITPQPLSKGSLISGYKLVGY